MFVAMLLRSAARKALSSGTHSSAGHRRLGAGRTRRNTLRSRSTPAECSAEHAAADADAAGAGAAAQCAASVFRSELCQADVRLSEPDSRPTPRGTCRPPNLTNSSMTDRLFRDGKIYLSINDAVAMAIENNLDITLQRYNLSIADTDILLTSSGHPARGVNASVVQGTPGGAIGSTASRWYRDSTATGATGTGAGGTQIGAGGAGAGAARYRLVDLGCRAADRQLRSSPDRQHPGRTCGNTAVEPDLLPACRPSRKTPTPTTSATPRDSPPAR